MEIQSFILGMCAVLLIALAIGSVFAIVKVIKFGREFREVQIWITQELEKAKDREREEKMIVGNQFQEVYRTLDSRLDKLYEKIIKEVNPSKAFYNLISKPAKENEGKPDDYDPETRAKRIKSIMDAIDNNKK